MYSRIKNITHSLLTAEIAEFGITYCSNFMMSITDKYLGLDWKSLIEQARLAATRSPICPDAYMNLKDVESGDTVESEFSLEYIPEKVLD